MRILNDKEINNVSGGIGNVGDVFIDPMSGETFNDLSSRYPGLYVAIGGRWVPTGTEPFIGPSKIPGGIIN